MPYLFFIAPYGHALEYESSLWTSVPPGAVDCLKLYATSCPAMQDTLRMLYILLHLMNALLQLENRLLASLRHLLWG